jgi:hypothetical protein
VQIGDVHLFLSSADVSMLADAINRLIEGMLKSHTGIHAPPESAGSLQAYVAELQELQQAFVPTSGSLPIRRSSSIAVSGGCFAWSSPMSRATSGAIAPPACASCGN